KRSISTILQEVIAHIEEIVRSQMRLARAEISLEIKKAARQSLKAVAAIILGLYALGFLLLGAIYGLAQTVPLWLAAVLVGATLAGTAALLWRAGRRQMSQIQPRLNLTAQTLKEDLSWIKKQTP